MKKISVINYASTAATFSSEVVKRCALIHVQKLKELIEQNVNIYSDEGCGIVPLTIAMHSKNEELIELLLDVYERDLSALEGTEFKKALVAYPHDQTDELLKHCKEQPTEKCVALLLKADNKTVPKLVFMSKMLESKDDMSLKLIKQLVKKKSFVDLNYNEVYGQKEDTLLHLAIYYGMLKITYRLLIHPTVDKSLVNHLDQNPLHYALSSAFSYAIHELFKLPVYSKWRDDPSYLYHIAAAGRRHLCSYILREITDFVKTLDDIMAWKFPVRIGFSDTDAIEGNMMHVFATSNDAEFFTNPPRSFTKEHYEAQTTNGMTVLHILVQNGEMKIQKKIGAIKKVCETHPQLLLIKDHDERLPLHYSCYNDSHGHNLYNTLHKLSCKFAGGKDIFS
jgi:hypothetical protein